jgi:hypothetical protein
MRGPAVRAVGDVRNSPERDANENGGHGAGPPCSGTAANSREVRFELDQGLMSPAHHKLPRRVTAATDGIMRQRLSTQRCIAPAGRRCASLDSGLRRPHEARDRSSPSALGDDVLVTTDRQVNPAPVKRPIAGHGPDENESAARAQSHGRGRHSTGAGLNPDTLLLHFVSHRQLKSHDEQPCDCRQHALAR